MPATSSTALQSAAEVATEFGIHEETVRRLYRDGRIPGYKVGRVLRFDVAEVREALRSSSSNATPARVVPNFDAVG